MNGTIVSTSQYSCKYTLIEIAFWSFRPIIDLIFRQINTKHFTSNISNKHSHSLAKSDKLDIHTRTQKTCTRTYKQTTAFPFDIGPILKINTVNNDYSIELAFGRWFGFSAVSVLVECCFLESRVWGKNSENSMWIRHVNDRRNVRMNPNDLFILFHLKLLSIEVIFRLWYVFEIFLKQEK